MPASATDVESVRAFNRFYTKRIGLLREGLLDSPFSLTQARVLFEIGRNPGTRSATLAADLGLDPGYLSRMLQSFERRQLIKRSKSSEDHRVFHLTFTAKGRNEFQCLDSRSREEVAAMLEALDGSRQRRLLDCMSAIRGMLEPSENAPPAVKLRSHRPGDIGWVVARHGELYAGEYGFDATFEGLVAEIAGKFLAHFDPQRERCWIAELDGARAGCVFLVKESATVAKLRLLLVEPWARGHAIGSLLVQECTSFARECGYRKLSLWTNDVLHAARKIYRREGFHLVREERHHSFGRDLVGQFWELNLR
jgi:DNA-binding MarR family transcriptional regulator/N-acetylglutamate synthase-like GNAT family acetyltransferase